MESLPPSSPRARRRRTWVTVGLGIGLLALLTYLFYPDRDTEPDEEPVEVAEAEPAEVDAVVVNPAPFSYRVVASGRLRATRISVVSAGASGVLAARDVQVGGSVRRGQVIGRIDARDARLALAEVETEVAAAEAKLSAAEAVYAADTRMSLSQLDSVGATIRERAARRAHARGHISDAELDAVVSEAPDRQERRSDAVDIARAEVARVRARVEVARLLVERALIRAPYSGVVSEVLADVGQYVSPSSEYVRLLDASPIEVEVNVLEQDLDGIVPGARADVRIPSLGGGAGRDGRVLRVDPIVDPESGAGTVIVQIPNPGMRLLPGLFAEVDIETGVLDDAISVPTAAVLERQGRPLVFVVDDGVAEWRPVQLGVRSATETVILDGLVGGETVAIDGHTALAQGARVRVRSPPP